LLVFFRVRPSVRFLAWSGVLAATSCGLLVREGKRGFFAIESGIRGGDVRIVLDRSFVEQYKNRATIETLFTIDRAGKQAHAGYLDGDLHVAGRAAEIGLPVVAEVQNGASRPDVIERVHRLAGSGEPIPLSGVWRLWSEHFGKDEQAQGESLAPIERTNPPHVFEIHPVTRLDDLDLADTFRPVPGFRPEPGEVTFDSLKEARLRIVPSEASITLYTRRQELNDAEFEVEIGNDPPQIAPDGRFVTGALLSPRGNRLADRVRMVFVRDTGPERIARRLSPGNRIHVFGIPRIDLSAVAFRVERGIADPRALEGKLPYEVVVVGVFPERAKAPRARREAAAAPLNPSASEPPRSLSFPELSGSGPGASSAGS
jgi:hypothetical protein